MLHERPHVGFDAGRVRTALGRHRTEPRAGERERDGLGVERVHRHQRRAEAVRLAQRHVQLRSADRGLGRVHPRRVPQDPGLLGNGAGQDTRVVGEEHHREGRNAPTTSRKRAALSAASLSIAPALTAGLFATTATDSPPRRTSAVTIDRPNVGLDLQTSRRRRPRSSDHRGDVVRPPGIGGDDVEQIVEPPRRRRSVGRAARASPGIRREVREVAADEIERRAVVGALRCGRPPRSRCGSPRRRAPPCSPPRPSPRRRAADRR